MTGLPRRAALPSSATPCLVRVRRPGSVPSFPPLRSWGPLERWSASGRAQPESTPLANPPHLGFNLGQARETGRLPHAAQSACSRSQRWLLVLMAGHTMLARSCPHLGTTVEDRTTSQPEIRQNPRPEVPSEELHPTSIASGRSDRRRPLAGEPA